MSKFITLFLAFIFSISARNDLRQEAQQHFENGELTESQTLLDSLLVVDTTTSRSVLLLNKAHAVLLQKDTALHPKEKYLDATLVENPVDSLSSIAHQMAGFLAFTQQDLEKAIEHSKSALRSSPGNIDARYNLELLYKLKEQNEKQNKDNKDKDNKDKNKDDKKKDDKKDQNKDNKQDNKDQKNQDQKDQDKKDQKKDDKKDQDQKGKDKKDEQKDGKKDDKKKDEKDKKGEESKSDGKKDDEDKKAPKPQEGEKGEEGKNKDKQQPYQPKQADAETLKKMGMSEERMKAILNALKNNEVQYLQQQRRKPEPRRDNDKPDW